MAESMQAVVKTRPARGAETRRVPVPSIGPDEVLLRVRAASICGTDIHIYRWDPWAAARIGGGRLPQILGHEVAGEVVEVGSAVRTLRGGDYVSCETHIFDPRDLQTLLGQSHVGERMSILGVDRDGTFAEYVAVPASVCWINDPAIPPEVASVQEPLGNATYAVLGEDGDVAGKTMVVIGDGPTGLFATAVARACGVAQIFLVGLADFSLEIGRRLGADHVLDASRDDLDRVAFVKDHTRGYGADLVLDMAGSPEGIAEGFKMLRKGGRFTAFGVLSESHVSIDYNNDVVFKGCQIHGVSGRKIFDTWYRVANLLASGRLEISPVITDILPLEGYEEGLMSMMSVPRRAAKVVLFPDREEMAAAERRRAERAGRRQEPEVSPRGGSGAS